MDRLDGRAHSRKQRPLKVGFYLHKDHAEEVEKSLPELLANRGVRTLEIECTNHSWYRLATETSVHSLVRGQVDVKFVHCGGLWFDVIPLRAGKGEALIYLQQKFRSDGKLSINTLVCGDSGNDVEMFGVPDVYGVVVGNAREELPQWCARNCKDHPNIIRATERCADGIIQAIGHFKLGPNKSPRDFSGSQVGRFNPVHEVIMLYLLYERWRRADVENSDSIVQNMRSIAVRHRLRFAISNFRWLYSSSRPWKSIEMFLAALLTLLIM
ncbi:sucrose-phosphatase [Musa troglodytarum]|uniref:Sucrose-phosphatase n=1 Tax=Musa troglodytarum TaxID=320322 RepID=A0A9E7EEH3_9LILI|nr:sucrose-phosphatase [Musa troglodytarum]